MRILFCFCFPRRRVGACLEGALNDAFLDLPYLILLLERTPEALASGGVISSAKGNQLKFLTLITAYHSLWRLWISCRKY